MTVLNQMAWEALAGVALVALLAAGVTPAQAAIVEPNHRVREFVTVRVRANAASTPRGYLRIGEQADLISTRPGWYRVRLEDGTEGFVLKGYIRVLTDAEPAAALDPPVGVVPLDVPPVSVGSREMNVHVIDVGQGAATLYEFPCGAMLIDTGSEENASFSGKAQLIAYLDRFFAGRPELGNRLDLLILSHAHVDHTRNAKAVIERYRPKHVVDNGLRTGSGYRGQVYLQDWAWTNGVPYDAIRIEEIASDAGVTSDIIDPISCVPVDPTIRVLFGRLKQGAHCLPGWTQTECKNGNNSSVVVRIDFDRFSILNTGDLEDTGIDELVSRSAASGVLDVDVYHLGHHGSRNGTTAELVSAMSPRIAVISMGDSDRELSWSAWAYGHPNRQALSHLVDDDTGVSESRTPVTVPVGVKGGSSPQWTTWTLDDAIYGTGWDGNIVIHTTSDGAYEVITAQ